MQHIYQQETRLNELGMSFQPAPQYSSRLIGAALLDEQTGKRQEDPGTWLKLQHLAIPVNLLPLHGLTEGGASFS